MRTREDIEQDAASLALSMADGPEIVSAGLVGCQLEVLLDIRDLLLAQDIRPAATFPASPPPPEVG